MRYSDKTFDIEETPSFEFVDVLSLNDGKVLTYSHTNPLRACALSYLQDDRHDLNTWNYGRMLVSGNMVSISCGGVQHLTQFRESDLIVSVGNYSAFKDGRRIPSTF